jgi:S1-C subfamily serine protease
MGGGYVIGGVSSTSDAASKGVVAGDIVVAIDGQSLGSLTLAEAAVLSFGAVGSTKVVTFESGLGGAMQSVPIQVEEFLPL